MSESVDSLIDELDSDDTECRLEALRSLIKEGPRALKATRALAMAYDDDSDEVNLGIKAAILSLGEGCIPELKSIICDKNLDENSRQQAGILLSNFGELSLEVFSGLLKSKDPLEVVIALENISSTGPHSIQVLPDLANLLNSPPPIPASSSMAIVRVTKITLDSGEKTPKYLGLVFNRLKSSDPKVRVESLNAIRFLENHLDLAKPHLLPLVNDPDQIVSKTCVRLLEQL